MGKVTGGFGVSNFYTEEFASNYSPSVSPLGGTFLKFQDMPTRAVEKDGRREGTRVARSGRCILVVD